MTAPTSGRDDATLRGAVVLVVAIVIGLALLARSGGGGGDDEATDGSTTTEASADASTTAGEGGTTVPIQGSSTTDSTLPTGSTQDPASVLVVVLNATPEVGWAGENAELLGAAGYETGQGNVSGDNQDASTIYAAPEAQADAQAVATLLGLGDATVSEKPADPLGRNGEDADADVVVVLGADSVGGGATDESTTDSTSDG